MGRSDTVTTAPNPTRSEENVFGQPETVPASSLEPSLVTPAPPDLKKGNLVTLRWHLMLQIQFFKEGTHSF